MVFFPPSLSMSADRTAFSCVAIAVWAFFTACIVPSVQPLPTPPTNQPTTDRDTSSRPPTPKSPSVTPPQLPKPGIRNEWTIRAQSGFEVYRLNITSVTTRNDSTLLHSTLRARITTAIDEAFPNYKVNTVVDSIMLQSTGEPGSDWVISLPRLELGASWSNTGLTTDTLDRERCESPEHQLIAKLHDIFPPVRTSRLTTETKWNDSTQVKTCQGTIPLIVDVRSFYEVKGDTSIDGATALHIVRSDFIDTMSGRGVSGFHNVSMSGTGKGASHIYISTDTKHLIYMKSRQEIKWTVSSSGKAEVLKQIVDQTISTSRGQAP
jgi:hypothetical protein